VLFVKTRDASSDWIVMAPPWSISGVSAICTAVACGSPDAHINPAITLAVAMLSKNWSNVGPFWIAQVFGGLAGAVLVWLVYLPHWKETEDAPAKLGIFCTQPAIRNMPANCLCEMIGTIIL